MSADFGPGGGGGGKSLPKEAKDKKHTRPFPKAGVPAALLSADSGLGG